MGFKRKLFIIIVFLMMISVKIYDYTAYASEMSQTTEALSAVAGLQTETVASSSAAESQAETALSSAAASLTENGTSASVMSTFPAETTVNGQAIQSEQVDSQPATESAVTDNSQVAAAVANNFFINQNLISGELNQQNGWQSSAGPVIIVEEGMTVNTKTNYTIYQDIVLPDENMAYKADFSCAQKNKSGILSKEDQGTVEFVFIKENGSVQSDSVKLSLDSYLEWTVRSQQITIPVGTKTVRIKLNGISRKLQLFNPDAFIDTYFKDVYFGLTDVSFAAGDGTSQNPYGIYSSYGMEYMLATLNAAAFYRLEADIDMTGLEWAPIGDRISKDNFNYNGHVVNGLVSSGVLGYNINFNTNGGTGVMPLMDMMLGTPLSSLATTSKTGYTFTGWYKDEALTQPIQIVEGNMTLYAGWQVNQYTLSFVVNRGDLTADPILVEYNTVPATLPELESHGFTFVGWYKDMALLEPVEINTPVTADTTYYGKWEDNYVGMSLDISKGDIIFQKLDDTHFYVIYNGKTSIDYTNNTEITVTGSSDANQILVNNGVNATICLSALEIKNGNKNPLYLMPQSNVELITKGKVQLQTVSNMSCIYLSSGSSLTLSGDINLDSSKAIAIGANGASEQGIFTLISGNIFYGANQEVWIIIIIVSCIIFVIVVLAVSLLLYNKSKKKAYLGAFAVDTDSDGTDMQNKDVKSIDKDNTGQNTESIKQ